MSMKNFPLALAMLLAVGGQAHARHVTHPVTPKNIDEQPFSFTVQVKDVGELKEFEITVGKQTGKRAPDGSASGSVRIAASGNRAPPTITRTLANDAQTYTFRVSLSDLDKASFTFTETPEDSKNPFPAPGDYWVFKLGDFVGSPKK